MLSDEEKLYQPEYALPVGLLNLREDPSSYRKVLAKIDEDEDDKKKQNG